MIEATMQGTLGLHSWPPLGDGVLWTQKWRSAVLTLHAQVGGSLSLEVKDDNETETFQFARIVFDGPISLLHVFLVCGKPPRLSICGTDIPIRFNRFVGRAVLVRTSASSAERLPKLPAIVAAVPATANEVEAVFVRKVHELEKLSESNDWYELLSASVPLRHLLLDGLLSSGNARARLKPIFIVNDHGAGPPIVPHSDWRCLSPEVAPTAKLLELKLDEYLKAAVLHIDGKVCTVRDVIRACANVSGGVHFGTSSSPGETAVVQFDKGQTLFGLQPSRVALRAMCQITVRALHPIVAKIQSS